MDITIRLPKVQSGHLNAMPKRILQRSVLTMRHKVIAQSLKHKKQQISSVDSEYLKLRKDYDELTAAVSDCSSKIKVKTKRLTANKIVQQDIEENLNKKQELISHLSIKKDRLELLAEQTVSQNLTFKHIVNKMQKDILIYKNRIKKQQQFNTRLKIKYQQALDYQKNLISSFNSLKVNFDKVQLECQQSVLQMNELYQQRRKLLVQDELVVANRTQHQAHVLDIQAQAASDILDANRIRMRNILTAHTVFQLIIRRKIKRQISHKSDLQYNFSKLKNGIGVDDPNCLIEKFYSSEKNYQNLINSIQQSQSKIHNLRNNKLQLQKKIEAIYKNRDKQIKFHNQLFSLFIKPKNSVQFSQDQEENQILTQQYCQVVLSRILDWVDLSISQLAQALNDIQLLPKRRDPLDLKMLKLIQIIKRELLNVQAQIEYQQAQNKSELSTSGRQNLLNALLSG